MNRKKRVQMFWNSAWWLALADRSQSQLRFAERFSRRNLSVLPARLRVLDHLYFLSAS